MKRLFLFAISILCLFSCGKMSTDSSALIGKWQLVKYERETVYANGDIKKESGTYEGNEYWDFNKEGTVKCIDKKGTVKEYTYSWDQDNMVLTIGSDRITVKELTRTSLVTVYSGNFIDGSVKPAGKGMNYQYNYWTKSF